MRGCGTARADREEFPVTGMPLPGDRVYRFEWEVMEYKDIRGLWKLPRLARLGDARLPESCS